LFTNKADVECAKPHVSFLAGKIFLRFYTFHIVGIIREKYLHADLKIGSP